LQRTKLKGGDPPTLWQYLSLRGDPELGAVFATLFWPELVEIEDCVLLKEHLAQTNFEEWKEACEGDRGCIEVSVNHIHVWDLFPNADGKDLNDAVFEYIARVLERCWSCAAKEAFPERTFVVEYSNEPQDYGPTVTLYQAALT
jgi:hypothetical protein